MKDGTTRIDLDGQEAALLALSRSERWIEINFAWLERTEGIPCRTVSLPDQLVSGADAKDRYWRGADCGEESS